MTPEKMTFYYNEIARYVAGNIYDDHNPFARDIIDLYFDNKNFKELISQVENIFE